MTKEHRSDVLIIGSGAAGLTCALHLAEHYNIHLLCKGKLSDAATYYAQGGIAAVLDDEDSVESHVEDTLIAGAGLCNRETVQYTVENSKAAIQWLIDHGVGFSTGKNSTSESPDYHLTREGGHSHRRIIHAADATGKAVQNTLSEAVINHKNIQLFENYNAIGLSDDSFFRHNWRNKQM